MTDETEGKETRMSRRRVILSGVAAVLATGTCAVFARRRGWTKRISSFLAHMGPNPTVELTFAAPFENNKPLLEKPVENDWVCVDGAFSDARDYTPKTQDMFQFSFRFRGETTKKGTPQQKLVDPYKIALLISMRDKQGKQYTARDEVVAYHPEVLSHVLGGFTTTYGENTYGGVFTLPIKLKDASNIQVRLTRVSSPL
jgi:hypothetical protein